MSQRFAEILRTEVNFLVNVYNVCNNAELKDDGDKTDTSIDRKWEAVKAATVYQHAYYTRQWSAEALDEMDGW